MKVKQSKGVEDRGVSAPNHAARLSPGYNPYLKPYPRKVRCWYETKAGKSIAMANAAGANFARRAARAKAEMNGTSMGGLLC